MFTSSQMINVSSCAFPIYAQSGKIYRSYSSRQLKRSFTLRACSLHGKSSLNTNPLNIQLLPPNIQSNVFPNTLTAVDDQAECNAQAMKISHMHLQNWNLDINQSSQLPRLDLKLPKLAGSNIAEHFTNIGNMYSQPIIEEIQTFIRACTTQSKPRMPLLSDWTPVAGWVLIPTEPNTEPKPVPYPDGPVLTFDIEVCPKLSNYPVMAVAQSASSWYAWTSPWLVNAILNKDANINDVPSDLIELGPNAKIVIGHNVGYDRARVSDEYSIKHPKRIWLDTLSIHVAVNGMSTQQRPVYNQCMKDASSLDKPPNLKRKLYDPKWVSFACNNSLQSCALFYLNQKVSKDSRNCFVDAESADLIVEHFDELIDYCASDVQITTQLFGKVFPLFQEKCPHPVSFLGQAAMGSCFLPVTSEWTQFWQACNKQVDDMLEKIELALISLAYYTVDVGIDRSRCTTYDGSFPELEGHEFPLTKYLPENLVLRTDVINSDPWLSQLDWTWKPLRLTKKGEPYKSQKLANYPTWFADLWDSKNRTVCVTQRKRVAPLLLQLRWAGHPIAFLEKEKWCYMVAPHLIDNHNETTKDVTKKLCSKDTSLSCWRDAGYRFFKLPHAAGDVHNSGSPFSKSFASYFDDMTVTSDHPQAREALDLQMKASYWMSAGERIRSQFVVWDNDNKCNPPNHENTFNATSTDSDSEIGRTPNHRSFGMILPQMKVMGTITRRAIEKTWLTASNAKKGRIGSDVKRYIVAPPGYAIVGADVDSEELWIASVMGDAQFGQHGASALGWMTLQGTKTHGTDLHSVTAKILGCSRDQAKVFNYARIYGAGEKFATTTLSQHNRDLSRSETEMKAKSLYQKTKGVKQKTKLAGITPDFDYWVGGRESYMFNAIESIAHSYNPRTPVLKCQIPNSLMVQNCGGNYLIDTYKIDARLMITIHDEIRYLVSESDKYRAAMALQISNLWTRALFVHQLGFKDLPLSVAFFSGVDIDHCLRKEVNDPCITPTNATPVSPGETLDIYQLYAKGDVACLVGSSGAADPVHLLSPSDGGVPSQKQLCTPHHLNWLLLQTMPDLDKFKEQRKAILPPDAQVKIYGGQSSKPKYPKSQKMQRFKNDYVFDGFSTLC